MLTLGLLQDLEYHEPLGSVKEGYPLVWDDKLHLGLVKGIVRRADLNEQLPVTSHAQVTTGTEVPLAIGE